ncbi:rhamnulokinase [Propioniciclava soli]|uniref:rhamnulokinase n=1 Tax=Propioniciclava soli TaxID=2775081 RepID=UPI001E48FA40|nr:FGGY-family carbohydrate kinase [Propioniciclava soli]
MAPTALAVDLGSSSGRVVAGSFDGEAVRQTEVYRFAHEAQRVDGHLCWDVDGILGHIATGLRAGVERFPDAATVSIDTWGVDFAALDAAGERVTLVRAYRDERTERTLPAFRERLDDAAVWAATGTAPALINTANQLFAFCTEEPDAAARVERVLPLPDYFVRELTGELGWSRSIASTTALTRPGAGTFSDEVFAALGLPRSWFGGVTPEHTVVGPCLLPGLERLTVVRGGAHDSACAVQALPRAVSSTTAFLSCGSWSVLGVLHDAPLLSDAARALGLTNEACAGGGLRPLFNITGLWMLQECQREWRRAGACHDIAELVTRASATPSAGVLIDPDDAGFARPGGMAERIGAAVAAGGGPPLDEGGTVRVVLESLAARYARGVRDLADLTGRPPDQVNVVGGGSRNGLLCQLTADAVGVPVVAGPAEASALGSLLAQLELTGAFGPDERAGVITASTATRTFDPAARGIE